MKLRALFDNKDDALFPNQFVNTRLLVRTISHATTLPTSTIQHDGTQTFVYVIANDLAHLQPVTTGVTEGELTQVDGIAPGAIVANSSFEKLQDKARIAIGQLGSGAPQRSGSAAP